MTFRNGFESLSMTNEELEAAQSHAIAAVLDVAPMLTSRLGSSGRLKDISRGEFRSYITEWDIAAQIEIIRYLKNFDSDLGFYAEEDGVSTNAEVYWTIDPIDGTEHFMSGNGKKCHTAIALMERQTCGVCSDEHQCNVPIAAVICNFESNTVYTATAASPSVKRVYDASTGRSEQAPLTSSKDFQSVECYGGLDNKASELGESLEDQFGAAVVQNTAASYSLVNIAAGKQSGLFVIDNPYTGQHDVAPGALLVVQAGGEAHNVGRNCLDVNPLKTAWRGVGNIIVSNGSKPSEVLDTSMSRYISDTK